MNRLDHIVIAAHSLDQGVDYIRETLGVEIPKGGFHKTMGTHNHLMQLGNEAYLELIAIDPEAEVPKHPRWFALDQNLMRASLKRGPLLVTWVMYTGNIQQLATQASYNIGTPTKLSRDNLHWEMALPDDGRLFADGLLPYCIQWHSSPHPSHRMRDLGCKLQKLTLYHNRPDWLIVRLISIGARKQVEVVAIADSETPYLTATIATPKGTVTI